VFKDSARCIPVPTTGNEIKKHQPVDSAVRNKLRSEGRFVVQ
jgi:hypothetical protein